MAFPFTWCPIALSPPVCLSGDRHEFCDQGRDTFQSGACSATAISMPWWSTWRSVTSFFPRRFGGKLRNGWAMLGEPLRSCSWIRMIRNSLCISSLNLCSGWIWSIYETWADNSSEQQQQHHFSAPSFSSLDLAFNRKFPGKSNTFRDLFSPGKRRSVWHSRSTSPSGTGRVQTAVKGAQNDASPGAREEWWEGDGI